MQNSLPVFALLFNAFVWGVSWWPFRHLHAAGLHPLWATALMYLLALVTLLVLLPGAWRQALRSPGLWLLAVSAGLTNVCFNWAVTVGDVVRVVLLFYLMPAWSVLLAWRVLGEVPTPMALLRLVLAFAGVVLVVLPPGVPLSQLAQGLSAVDLLAVTGGFTFALTNVMLRRLHQVPEQARMLAMFGGGALMAALVAVTGMAVGIVTPVPPVATGWVLLALGLATAFLLGNYALQYGAARLAAGTTALVMLTEVVFASTSSWLLDAAALQERTLVGGACIMLAALLAVVPARRRLT
ncbi:MAG TPA: DMT family transporter [Giesbergeria sp.]|nr:DMT family transporter [Giesbergeria sp.]HRA14366.1 DMT family transporter [Giesbergeria sp.]